MAPPEGEGLEREKDEDERHGFELPVRGAHQDGHGVDA